MKREWEDAVIRGRIEELQRLVASGADIDARDRHGQTSLMRAASEGQSHVVAWLVERGAALDHTGKHGLSALMLAVVRGHTDAVRRLVDAGANMSLRGTGAPGFAGKTALDLAVARDDPEMLGILRSAAARRAMTGNPHFETAPSWTAARVMLTFQPVEPKLTAGLALQSIRIHARDHRMRELPVGDRMLEAHYGGFVLSQSRKGVREARRLALAVSYGPAALEARIAGHEGRVYDLGPDPPPDDIDGRSPSVLTWHDADMFYLIASGEMPSEDLVTIANSLYSASSR